MPPHVLGALMSQPLDFYHAAVALMIGVAGGCLLAELKIEPLRKALARKPKPPANPADHGGPWG